MQLIQKVQFIFAAEIIVNPAAVGWKINDIVHCQTPSQLKNERNKARFEVEDALNEEYSEPELGNSVMAWEERNNEITGFRTMELEQRWGSLEDFHTRYLEVKGLVNKLANEDYPLYEITYPGDETGYTDDPDVWNGIHSIREKTKHAQWIPIKIAKNDLSKQRNFLMERFNDGPWQSTTLPYQCTQGRK